MFIQGSSAHDFYDAVAEGYDSKYKSGPFLAENEQIADQLSKIINGRKIVDLGCGTGLFLELFPKYPSYLGIDASAHMIQRARHKFPSYDFKVLQFDRLNPDLICREDPIAMISLFGSPSYFGSADLTARKLAEFPNGTAFFLMYYSLRNVEKPDYIANSEGVSLSRYIYSAKELYDSFSSFHFKSLSVRPFSCSLAGKSSMSKREAQKRLEAENLLADILEDKGFFQIVEGEI